MAPCLCWFTLLTLSDPLYKDRTESRIYNSVRSTLLRKSAEEQTGPGSRRAASVGCVPVRRHEQPPSLRARGPCVCMCWHHMFITMTTTTGHWDQGTGVDEDSEAGAAIELKSFWKISIGKQLLEQIMWELTQISIDLLLLFWGTSLQPFGGLPRPTTSTYGCFSEGAGSCQSCSASICREPRAWQSAPPQGNAQQQLPGLCFRDPWTSEGGCRTIQKSRYYCSVIF